jgi:hypothetical protein
MSVAQPAAVGATYRIVACNAPAGTPRVEVVVRRCMEIGGRYEIGCEFAETVPWGVLLMFG